VQLRFNKADMAQAPTKGRVLDHIGFDVKDLPAFIKKLEANGVKLDRPYTKNEQTGAALAFITDPWGTYIELNERPQRRLYQLRYVTRHVAPSLRFRGEGGDCRSAQAEIAPQARVIAMSPSHSATRA
jgi:extradiol dioxygenase family protein